MGLLLFVLIYGAHTAWVARGRSTDWKTSVQVAVYPLASDDSAVTFDCVRALRVETVQPIAALKSEVARHGVALDTPVKVYLAHAMESSPPSPPFGGSTLDGMLWSLKCRYWVWRVGHHKRPKPDVRLFVRFLDPGRTSRVPHSKGLHKGQIGIVNAFAHATLEGANKVVITHEFLRTLGASDKYDFATNQPLHPDGYAEPEA